METVTPSSTLKYDTEHRNVADDAWYSVSTIIAGEKLVVKYLNFAEDQDNVFSPENFKSREELNLFIKRFRPVSPQLQDNECHKVKCGTLVCASHSSIDGKDNRFYDAVVENVNQKEHLFTDGEEECRCTFIVMWQHGPGLGCLATKSIENVCLVQLEGRLNQSVASFIEITSRKLERMVEHMPFSLGNHRSVASNSNSCSKVLVSSPKIQESTSRGRTGEDSDFGGHEKRHIVLIDNMEKDILPSTIVEFIHRQTLIDVEAFVLPSLVWEKYARGAIVLDGAKKLKDLSEFLDSSNHIVVSKKGRPWVVSGKFCELDIHNLLKSASKKFNHLNLKQRTTKVSDDLKVVHAGSEEYRTAKQLRDLFMVFSEHQKGLHERLVMEERKIVQ